VQRASRLHQAGERYYVGRRTRETEVYVVTRTHVEALEHPRYQTNTPFDWGDLTPGALELAFAVLVHSTGQRPPAPICETLRADVIADLHRAGFVLGEGDIALWLLTAFREDDLL
jgi:hypothetical protein